MLIKQQPITSQKPVSREYCRMAKGVLKEDRFVLPPQCNGPEVLSSSTVKARLIPEILFENSNFNNSSISLAVCPPRAKNIPVTSSS